MPQESLSSLTQSIGNAGYLTLARIDTTGASPTVSVSFVPGLATMTHPQPSPLQHVNVAIGGQIHIYAYASAEPLLFTCTFHDLPFADDDPFQPIATQGFRALQSFIRYTLDYHRNVCRVTTPDGYIEDMRYLGGLDTFQEATGQTNKVQRWSGEIILGREIA